MALPLILDAVASIGGLIIPPAFDFIKKKFIKTENDTPERTIGTLATTNPEALPAYVEALAKFKDAEVKFFNRDVIGTPRPWIVDLRAAIRPIVVCVGLVFMLLNIMEGMRIMDSPLIIDQGTRMFFELVISSWFGTRVFQSK